MLVIDLLTLLNSFLLSTYNIVKNFLIYSPLHYPLVACSENVSGIWLSEYPCYFASVRFSFSMGNTALSD
ncbi:hypothetical protein SAMN05428962_1859 [Paenibacillus sp. BC26]|nr:hypothetical protein SAMN05428962_1859 [Paenibacillus sp. BC26]